MSGLLPQLFLTGDLRRRVARALMRLLFGAPVPASTDPLPLSGIHRILVCHVSLTLGNAVLLTPLLREIEATWPGAEVDIVTRSKMGPTLYGRFGCLRQVIQLPYHGVGQPRRWLAAVKMMRGNHYDLAIDPDPQSQTGRLLLLRANASRKLGYSGPTKSGSISNPVRIPEAISGVGQRSVHLLRSARGMQDQSIEYPVPDIGLDENELTRGRQALARVLLTRSPGSPRSRVIGIFANATGHKAKGLDWWTSVLDSLEARCPDCQPVEIIPVFGRSLLASRYPTYCSSDLRKVASVLASLDACITLDCGIMHLACASRVPTLGIFTSTGAQEWGPYGAGNYAIAAQRLSPEALAQELAGRLDQLPPRRAET